MVSTHLPLLMFNCFLAVASVRMAHRSAQDASFPQSSSSGDVDQDVVLQHMSKLYERYNSEQHIKEGNTVRSFRASQVPSDLRTVYHLNLTTLQDSEVILSATFHFLLGRLPPPKAWMCKRFKSPSCRPSATHPSPSISLLFRATSSGSGVSSGSLGSFLGNATFHPHRRGVWQMKDVTQVIKKARDKGHLLVSVELDLGQHYQRKAEESGMSYLVVFADDQALAEPNSVAPSLQRYDPLSDRVEPSQSPHLLQGPNFLPDLKGRVRREATSLPDSIENNELPEVDYRLDGYRKDDLWESLWYPAIKPKMKVGKQEKKRKSQEEGVQQGRGGHHREESSKRTSDEPKSQDSFVRRHKDSRTEVVDSRRHEHRHEGRDGRKHKKGSAHPRSQILSFDEQTMRKARRRQWGDTRHQGCSRRNLRVDFADIGWSEWVIAPKAFDAYYCSGTCGFPMPKVVRPSNHATIQSIVRAVGIISGVPEPCCVPEKISPLAVLYQEESKDLVLKIYPNMSVQSCSCR
ncbi:growth/differentiation factor 10-like [Dunckerocampus dactyliophorus]|uniref:growth/differentiation factor 10-like n=1 Tax=Dunckerocampus dactyliophorus TaxID=161453 RepID=UPI002406D1C3|nr:growth/differentiation factor 10-like [Dunckerocampus dactyliophorus]